MREILFKAKSTYIGEWVEGYYVYYAWTGKQRHYIVPNYASDLYAFGVDPKTICQYTGLTDKNGQKIWENDIVRAWSEGSCAVGEARQRIDGLWIIFPAWQDREFWGLCPNDKGETTVEVIGNVFDNPNLLKGGDDT